MRIIKNITTFALLSLFASFSVTAADIVRLATTTSTYHSGLLDYLVPEFKKESGYDIQILAAGTGKA